MTTNYHQNLDISFYLSGNGQAPVKEWCKTFDKKDRKIIGLDIRAVASNFGRGKRYESLGGGLHEVRSITKYHIARIIFCIKGTKMVLLHGFVKKCDKTPLHDIKLALARKKEILSN